MSKQDRERRPLFEVAFRMAQKVLVTGGGGYIGSHCVVELIEAGFCPVVIDNFSNAVRAVGESVEQPLRYYRVNLTATMNLLEVMQTHGVRNLVFSSSATVYGDPQRLPIDEQHPVGGCTNPYGKTKYFIEEMIMDQCKAEKDWNAVLLRYFNPIGAHSSGLIGEDPQGIPNNLLPYVAQVYNLGTGTGYSVLQMVKAMEKASGREIMYLIAPRRGGDVASCYADPRLAEKELGWKADFDLERMCKDLWHWQSKNPTGFTNNGPSS
ncbi:unnamed protein product [Coregonus sp. 'balchen']|nr:unnamed protein product [Coregonus sp. 'balchen']